MVFKKCKGCLTGLREPGQRDHPPRYEKGHGHEIQNERIIKGLDNPELDEVAGEYAEELRENLELVIGASHSFDLEAYLAGELTPVYFGTALGNFGVREMLAGLIEYAPAPQPRESDQGDISPEETELTGFIFKIQHFRLNYGGIFIILPL